MAPGSSHGIDCRSPHVVTYVVNTGHVQQAVVLPQLVQYVFLLSFEGTCKHIFGARTNTVIDMNVHVQRMLACVPGRTSDEGMCSASGTWCISSKLDNTGQPLLVGLDAARQLGLPISEHETLFSTPADLDELEGLLNGHPYPQVSKDWN